MSSGAESRNFSDFIYGDNVRALGGYVLSEIAAYAGVDLEYGTAPPSLDKLVEIETRLRSGIGSEDEPIHEIVTLKEAAELVDRSGICAPVNRSLYDARDSHTDYTVSLLAGDTPYAFDWAARRLVGSRMTNSMVTVASNRIMDTAEDTRHPRVLGYRERYGRFPTEYDYFGLDAARLITARAAKVVQDRIDRKKQQEGDDYSEDSVDLSMPLDIVGTGEESDDALIESIFKAGDFYADDVAVVNVAGRGLEIACRLHALGRRHVPDNVEVYNSRKNSQVFINSGKVLVARTELQLTRPASYLSPYDGMRRVVAAAQALAATYPRVS